MRQEQVPKAKEWQWSEKGDQITLTGQLYAEYKASGTAIIPQDSPVYIKQGAVIKVWPEHVDSEGARVTFVPGEESGTYAIRLDKVVDPRAEPSPESRWTQIAEDVYFDRLNKYRELTREQIVKENEATDRLKRQGFVTGGRIKDSVADTLHTVTWHTKVFKIAGEPGYEIEIEMIQIGLEPLFYPPTEFERYADKYKPI